MNPGSYYCLLPRFLSWDLLLTQAQIKIEIVRLQTNLERTTRLITVAGLTTTDNFDFGYYNTNNDCGPTST
ncbi:MAG: hypothetical protein IPJ39_18510 [Saprospiraceae bacterium]|nr:hypothetical protein [Saprospiraceae bacterium]